VYLRLGSKTQPYPEHCEEFWKPTRTQSHLTMRKLRKLMMCGQKTEIAPGAGERTLGLRGSGSDFVRIFSACSMLAMRTASSSPCNVREFRNLSFRTLCVSGGNSRRLDRIVKGFESCGSFFPGQCVEVGLKNGRNFIGCYMAWQFALVLHCWAPTLQDRDGRNACLGFTPSTP
jgi:hypothetical protein